jgi:hypothetical protein
MKLLDEVTALLNRVIAISVALRCGVANQCADEMLGCSHIV